MSVTPTTPEDDNEDRREEDAEARLESRIFDLPEGSNGESVRVHVVSWVNNTVWRVAVALAFAASLFSIYDNNARVERLEQQVCDTVYASDSAIDSLEYYQTRPDERAEAHARNREVLKTFHCPNPRSPVLEGFGRVNLGVVEFGRATGADDDR